MSYTFARHDGAGRLLSTGHVSKALPTGDYVLTDDVRAHPELHYAANGILLARPACPVALVSVVGLVVTLSGIPMGATVYAARDGVENSWVQDDADGFMEVTSPVAGLYVFRVELFPQQRYYAELELT